MAPNYIPALCGFAFFQAFCYLAFESPSLLDAFNMHDDLAQPLFLLCAIFGQFIAYALTTMIRLAEQSSSLTKPNWTLALSLTASGLALSWVSCILCVHASIDITIPWFVAGAIALGAGSALVNLLWAHYSCLIEDCRKLYVFVLTANLLSLAVYFLATHLPRHLVSFFALGLVVVSTACAAVALFAPQTTSQEDSIGIPMTTNAFHILWKPALAALLLGFIASLMLQMPHIQDTELSYFQKIAFISQVVVIGLLALPTLIGRHQPNFEALFKIALPLSAAGFALLPLLYQAGSGIENALAQLGFGIASMLLWCMLAQTSNSQGVPSETIYATVLGIICLAKICGTLAGVQFRAELGKGGVALTGVSLAAIYLIAMIPMFLFKSRDTQHGAFTEQGEIESRSDGTHTTQDTGTRTPPARQFAQYVARFNLTPREIEMLDELAQGRTLHAIADKQGVSENTVKYHVRGIYQKCGVHTRDELINLLEAN